MSVWLTADQVAERLGVSRRTAIAMMHEMPHTVLSGTQRKTIRVSEAQLESWLMKRSTGKPVQTVCTGSKRKLARREV